MDKVSTNIYLNMIAIIMTIAFVKMRIKNNIRDREVIIFSLRIEKKIALTQIFFISAATAGLAKLLSYHITLDKIVGNIYWITFAVLFFIVSGRKIVLTNNGVAYRYWLGNLNYIFLWSSVESYYIIPMENKHRNKITITYVNDRFKMKTMNLWTSQKYKNKIRYLFKEYVLENNKESNCEVTLKN